MDLSKKSPESMHMSGEQMIFPGLIGDALDPDNRWMQLSRTIPWAVIEDHYGALFDRRRGGPHPISARVAFGSLIVQQRLGLTDVETVAFIQENPYVQAFLGYASFSAQRPYDASLLTHFRKRFQLGDLQDINELIVSTHRGSDSRTDSHSKENDPPSGSGQDDAVGHSETPPSSSAPSTGGTLMMDATCVPADIAYPTDLHLLNHAREITEHLIDELHEPHVGIRTKPRTHRQKARQKFLVVAKSKRVTRQKARKACRQQLRYLRRNLAFLQQHCDQGVWDLRQLAPSWYRKLLVISELVRQQRLMNMDGERTVSNRIVSIHQPHVRPIVRGKAGTPVEFGAKIAVTHDGGFAFLERVSWDAYHEGNDLTAHADQYQARHGHYPERILADKIYRTRANRNWCTERGIRLAGVGPGRPPKDRARLKAIHKEARQDEADRQPMEGIFGRSKRRFNLDRLLTRLPNTSANAIALVMIILNLEKIIWVWIHWLFLCRLSSWSRVMGFSSSRLMIAG